MQHPRVWHLFLLLLEFTQAEQQAEPMQYPPVDPDMERIHCGGFSAEDITDQPRPSMAQTNPFVQSQWQPLRIEYVINSPVTKAMESALQRAFDSVNSRLGNIMKTFPLTELRVNRKYESLSDKCSKEFCREQRVPAEYNKPCFSPDNELIAESGVPTQEATKVREARERNTSVVVFVRVVFAQQAPYYHGCERDIRGYARACHRDSATIRPTHGHIALCIMPDKTSDEALSSVLLHETIHILTFGSLLGYYNPVRFGLYIADEDRYSYRADEMKTRAEGSSWSKVKFPWKLPNGSVEQHESMAAMSPEVKKVVESYFRCRIDNNPHSYFKGAEVSKRPSEGQLLTDDAHWSLRLFPDDIIAPTLVRHPRLSKLTLAALYDTGWYDVDISKGETLMFDGSNKGGSDTNFCSLATKSCHEVLDNARQMHLAAPNTTFVWTGAYCDPKGLGFNQRSCTDDGRTRLRCREGKFTDGCYVHQVTLEGYEHYDADCEDNLWQLPNVRLTGFWVGPGSMCLTFTGLIALNLSLFRRPVYAGCLGFRCEPDGIRFLLKQTQYFDTTADRYECWTPVVCPNISSPVKRTWPSPVGRCEGLFGDVICPDYKAVCKTPGGAGAPKALPPATDYAIRMKSRFIVVIGSLSVILKC